mmetsp:Transcript_72717/g.151911  ORF Transcript_72717/g.151911 Transcript_72717/m.151911 type:complete len:312 (+) Transcript_72717:162-1097(+)
MSANANNFSALRSECNPAASPSNRTPVRTRCPPTAKEHDRTKSPSSSEENERKPILRHPKTTNAQHSLAIRSKQTHDTPSSSEQNKRTQHAFVMPRKRTTQHTRFLRQPNQHSPHAMKSAMTITAISIAARAPACSASSTSTAGYLASPVYPRKYPSTKLSVSAPCSSTTSLGISLSVRCPTIGTPDEASPPASTSKKLTCSFRSSASNSARGIGPLLPQMSTKLASSNAMSRSRSPTSAPALAVAARFSSSSCGALPVDGGGRSTRLFACALQWNSPKSRRHMSSWYVPHDTRLSCKRRRIRPQSRPRRE